MVSNVIVCLSYFFVEEHIEVKSIIFVWWSIVERRNADSIYIRRTRLQRIYWTGHIFKKSSKSPRVKHSGVSSQSREELWPAVLLLQVTETIPANTQTNKQWYPANNGKSFVPIETVRDQAILLWNPTTRSTELLKGRSLGMHGVSSMHRPAKLSGARTGGKTLVDSIAHMDHGWG